jgi:predicted PurR-regulated permease PerM
MAIYNISDLYEKEVAQKILSSSASEEKAPEKKDRLLSSIAARVFFGLLLIVDVLWGIFSIIRFFLYFILSMLFCFKNRFIQKQLAKAWLACKRAVVCAISLVVAIFSPALGILFSCMYFLMYDQAGVDEIVPASLKDQFKEFFQH